MKISTTNHDEYATHTVSEFSLEIGNNYTMDHFTTFLSEQRPEIVDAIMYGVFDLEDIVTFIYRGTYGDHEDTFAMSDLHDFLR